MTSRFQHERLITSIGMLILLTACNAAPE